MQLKDTSYITLITVMTVARRPEKTDKTRVIVQKHWGQPQLFKYKCPAVDSRNARINPISS